MEEEHGYVCRFCLEERVTESFDYPTDPCPSCRVGYCNECDCAVKVGTAMCPSCGQVAPELRGEYGRSGNFGTFYMAENWIKTQIAAVGADPAKPDRHYCLAHHVSGTYLRRNELEGTSIPLSEEDLARLQALQEDST